MKLNINKFNISKKDMAKKELEWRAEEDARTIERYNEIIKDKSRLNRAIGAAKKQIENLSERAAALNRSITGINKKK